MILIRDNHSQKEFFSLINEVLNESAVGDLQLFDLVSYAMGNILARQDVAIRKSVHDFTRLPSMCRRIIKDRSAEVSYDLAKNFLWLLPNWLGEDIASNWLAYYDQAVVEDMLEICGYMASTYPL